MKGTEIKIRSGRKGPVCEPVEERFNKLVVPDKGENVEVGDYYYVEEVLHDTKPDNPSRGVRFVSLVGHHDIADEQRRENKMRREAEEIERQLDQQLPNGWHYILPLESKVERRLKSLKAIASSTSLKEAIRLWRWTAEKKSAVRTGGRCIKEALRRLRSFRRNEKEESNLLKREMEIRDGIFVRIDIRRAKVDGVRTVYYRAEKRQKKTTPSPDGMRPGGQVISVTREVPKDADVDLSDEEVEEANKFIRQVERELSWRREARRWRERRKKRRAQNTRRKRDRLQARKKNWEAAKDFWEEKSEQAKKACNKGIRMDRPS